MFERKLATIRKIVEIKEIPNADKIEACRVDGWWVVCNKGQFKVDNLVCYFEIDSWIPESISPFLFKGEVYEDVPGAKLRTVRLRKQVSQGLILPLHELPAPRSFLENLPEGYDLTSTLGIKLHVKPIPANLRGKVIGRLPGVWRKTDQERVENLTAKIPNSLDIKFEITRKLDGTSMSVGTDAYGEFTICGRNARYSLDSDNAYTRAAKELNLEAPLLKLFDDIGPVQISGELYGLGVQGNPEKLTDLQFYVYDVYLPAQDRYLDREERLKLLSKLPKMQHVPTLAIYTLREMNLETIEDIIEYANTAVTKNQEGVVFKAMDGSFSFKAISNKYLLKEK